MMQVILWKSPNKKNKKNEYLDNNVAGDGRKRDRSGRPTVKIQ